MKKLLNHHSTAVSILGLVAIVILLLLIVPPEHTLGHIIKAVFLHGVLVQTGLLTFAATGIIGIVYLLMQREALYHWCIAMQKTGVIVWSVYILSSVVVTYLAWGVPVAWNEPRVRISATIWATCLAFLLLGRLAQQRVFAAILNIALAIAAWGLVKSAGILRHPFDPIGTSDSPIFKIVYAALGIVMLLIAIQMTRWWYMQANLPSEFRE